MGVGMPVSDLTELRFVLIPLHAPDSIFKMFQHLMLSSIYESPQPSACFQLDTGRIAFPSIDNALVCVCMEWVLLTVYKYVYDPLTVTELNAQFL